MADIELVIKLDEEYIKQIDRIRFLIGTKEDRSLQVNVINAIKNGTPLPKMGMTIEEIIQGIEVIKAQAEWEYPLDWQIVLDTAIATMRKYQQLEDFAKWVAVEVIDEEMWTYNHLAFAELACRKLVQLGIMQKSDGEYSYEVVEDGNNNQHN